MTRGIADRIITLSDCRFLNCYSAADPFKSGGVNEYSLLDYPKVLPTAERQRRKKDPHPNHGRNTFPGMMEVSASSRNTEYDAVRTMKTESDFMIFPCLE
jgi:hypothetical protein